MPAFRVGAVPYGVLPAISVSRMVPAAGENGTAITVMARLLSFWKNAAAKVKTVPRKSAHLNLDLMNVLTQKSHSDGVYVRNTIGVQTVTNLYQLLFQNFAEFLNALTKPVPSILGPIGHQEWAAARIFSLNFLPTAPQYAGPLVTINPANGQLVSGIPSVDQHTPEDALNYLALLGSPNLTEIKVENQAGMLNAAPPLTLLPLLYLLARHSYLTEMVEIGRRLLSSSFTNHKALDMEHWFILPTQASTPIFPILKSTPSGYPRTLFESVKLNKNATPTGVLDPSTPDTPAQFPELRAALGNLSVLPVADLERLMAETLDLAAHRLDAFVTGLATRRLLKFRAAERGTQPIPVHPATNYYGAYGFVEDVRPTARTTRQIPGLGPVDVQANNGGFIHAPSLRHATTAAILRSGRMSEKADPTKYAIELSSARARSARELMDGLRDGQTQGAILGARLESGLRAAGQAAQPPINQMEAYILALRLLFPQVANKSGNDAGLPANRIAARNVLDGKLVRDWMATHPDLPYGSGGLPPANDRAVPIIRAEVKKLDDVMDALGDLVMAEAVYQIAAGDAITAEAVTSFMPAGNAPPEPQVTESPTTGVAVNHRVALVMEPTTAQPVDGWTTTTPRAAVDPFVEDWAERQLGTPTTVTATISYQVSGTPGQPQPPPATTTFSMADLHIGALDFLALAQSTSVPGQRSPLDRMIDQLFREGLPEATILDVTYDTPGASGRNIAQFFELARSLGGVLGSARELTVADLRRAEDGIDDDALQGTADGLTDQAQAAIGALTTVRDELAGGDLAGALRDASAYLADAFPDANASQIELEAAAIGAQSELARRVTDAQKELDAANASATNAARIAGAIQALRVVFGRNTLAVMPAFAVQGADEIKKSLANLDRPLVITDPATFERAPGALALSPAGVARSRAARGLAPLPDVRRRVRCRRAPRLRRAAAVRRDRRLGGTLAAADQPDVAGAGVGERPDRCPQHGPAVARSAPRSVDGDRAERQGGDRARVPLRQPELRSAAGDPVRRALRPGRGRLDARRAVLHRQRNDGSRPVAPGRQRHARAGSARSADRPRIQSGEQHREHHHRTGIAARAAPHRVTQWHQ